MRHHLFYLFKYIAIIIRPLLGRKAYMTIYEFALKQRGVNFTGKPRYIDPDVYIDATGGLSIGKDFVASTRSIILTHDYSYTTGLGSIGNRPDTDIEIRLPVKIGNNVFVGAGAIILPGTTVGDNVIIGAGSVVKGTIENDMVVVGNPAKKISDIKQWVESQNANTEPKAFFKDKR